MHPKLFRAYRDLKKSLGRLDASFAYVALCLRHFEKAADASGDRLEFHSKTAAEFKLRVRLPSDEEPRKHVYLSATVGIFAEFDRFLIDLASELPSLTDLNVDMSRRPDGESRLEFLLSELSKSDAGLRSQLPRVHLSVCEYLRLTRNRYAHNAAEVPRKATRLHRELGGSESFKSEFGALALSPAPCEVDFDDIVIFSIGVKRLAERLCGHLAPGPDRLLEHPDTRNFLARGGVEVSSGSFMCFLFDRFGLNREDAGKLSELLKQSGTLV